MITGRQRRPMIGTDSSRYSTWPLKRRMATICLNEASERARGSLGDSEVNRAKERKEEL